MIVNEDLKTGAIVVKVRYRQLLTSISYLIYFTMKQVTDQILLQSVSNGAGSIQAGDILIKIENEDITNIPLLRGSAKINSCII